MSLLILPNETLYKVWEKIHPNDIVNFMLTCKTVHQLAGPALRRDREYRQRYHLLRLRCVEHESVIRALTQCPREQAYRRTLEIEPQISASVPSTWRVLPPYLQAVYKLIDRCRYIVPESKALWKTKVGSVGSEGALIALLLVSLPNLRTLILPYWRISDAWLVQLVMQHMVADSEGSDALQVLSQANLSSYGHASRGSLPNDLGFLALFAALPSMRTLVEIEGPGMPSEPPKDGCIDISILRPVNSFEFLAFLNGVKNLRSFSYWWPTTGEQTHRWTPSYIVQGLQPFYGTLEQLTLVSNRRIYIQRLRQGEGDLFVGSLREFTALRSITIDSWLLLRGAARRTEDLTTEKLDNRLVDILPESCEELLLRNCQFRRGALQEDHELGYKRMRSLFLGLRTWKDERLPKLKTVTIKTNSHPRFAPWLWNYKCEGLEVKLKYILDHQD
ncbi:hypothetical protein MMC14_000845 [Varicellaria rhodocarpa]|nr:hypothetical protein [Varicellaria rhodocarpa]